MKSDIMCIYHKDCADGFASALAVWVYCRQHRLECSFIAAHYKEAPPEINGEDVVIVDFSYDRDVLLVIKEKAGNLIVIDHHESAERKLKGLDFCVFDMAQSGAVLTWKELLPDSKMPLLFKYIQDRDLWLWELDHTREVSAGLLGLPMLFDTWAYYLDDNNIEQLIESGAAILGYQQQRLKKILGRKPAMVEIAGFTVPCINATHLISEVGNELCKGYPFSASYFESDEQRHYSLRSDEDGINVAKIAEKFGGGGHAHAAGFAVKKPEFVIAA